MPRAFGKLILLGIFLCAQLFAVIHYAQYGESYHSHGDNPCTTQLLSEAGKGLSAPLPVVLAVPPTTRISPATPSSQLYGCGSLLAFSIRAPPTASA